MIESLTSQIIGVFVFISYKKLKTTKQRWQIVKKTLLARIVV